LGNSPTKDRESIKRDGLVDFISVQQFAAGDRSIEDLIEMDFAFAVCLFVSHPLFQPDSG